jgi:uncharacterized protein (TIGR00369 family)
MMSGSIAVPPMVRLLGLRLVAVDAGRVVVLGAVTDEFYNGMATAHGGWAATVLDTALGCAVNSAMPAGRLFTTVELTINYTRPIRAELGELRCEATVLHAGSRLATAEARLTDASGKLYAHATTICMIVERDSNA